MRKMFSGVVEMGLVNPTEIRRYEKQSKRWVRQQLKIIVENTAPNYIMKENERRNVDHRQNTLTIQWQRKRNARTIRANLIHALHQCILTTTYWQSPTQTNSKNSCDKQKIIKMCGPQHVLLRRFHLCLCTQARCDFSYEIRLRGFTNTLKLQISIQ